MASCVFSCQCITNTLPVMIKAALIRKRAHLDQYILILQINFKAQNRKTKTNTNPSPVVLTLTDTGGAVLTPMLLHNARIQKFIHYTASQHHNK